MCICRTSLRGQLLCCQPAAGRRFPLFPSCRPGLYWGPPPLTRPNLIKLERGKKCCILDLYMFDSIHYQLAQRTIVRSRCNRHPEGMDLIFFIITRNHHREMWAGASWWGLRRGRRSSLWRPCGECSTGQWSGRGPGWGYRGTRPSSLTSGPWWPTTGQDKAGRLSHDHVIIVTLHVTGLIHFQTPMGSD